MIRRVVAALMAAAAIAPAAAQVPGHDRPPSGPGRDGGRAERGGGSPDGRHHDGGMAVAPMRNPGADRMAPAAALPQQRADRAPRATGGDRSEGWRSDRRNDPSRSGNPQWNGAPENSAFGNGGGLAGDPGAALRDRQRRERDHGPIGDPGRYDGRASRPGGNASPPRTWTEPGRFGWSSGTSPRWNRQWRNDARYDWGQFRRGNRDFYRLPRYYAPPAWHYGYRRFSIGVTLSSVLWDQDYWIDDAAYYRLPPAYGPYRWVRYYDDALLVDIRTGEVVDTVYDIFW